MMHPCKILPIQITSTKSIWETLFFEAKYVLSGETRKQVIWLVAQTLFLVLYLIIQTFNNAYKLYTVLHETQEKIWAVSAVNLR